MHARPARSVRFLYLLVPLLAVLAAIAADQYVPRADADVYYGCEPARTAGTSETSGAGGLMLGADLDELTDGSAIAAAGTVRSLQTCYSSDDISIVTFVTMDVDEALKVEDDNPATTIRIAVPGGTIGGYTLAVGTSPEFTAGERVIAFLAIDSHGDAIPSFGFQGVFRILPDGTVERANVPYGEFAEAVGEADSGELADADDPLADGPEIIESEYKLNGPKFNDADIPMQVNINADANRPSQISAQEMRLAVINAYQSWQDLPESYIAFGPFKNTNRTSKQGDCDGNHDTTWKISGSHGASTLAVAYTCYSGTKILDGDIEIDTDHFGAKWRVDGSGACGSGKYDLQTVLLHESGHFFGLGHPSNNGCQPCPVMDASYGGVNRDPCSDDENGANSLYSPGTGITPPSPLALEALPGSSITLNWGNVSNEMGFEVWRADGLCLVAPFELHDTVKADTTTYVDNNYGGGLGTAAYCYEVRAFNKNGESAFSLPAQGLAGGLTTPSPSPTASTPPTPSASPSPSPSPTPAPTPAPTPSASPAPMAGDVNCDSLITPLDSIGILSDVGEIADAAPCIDNGDIDCSGQVDTRDALVVLLVVSGVTTVQGACGYLD